MQIHTSGRDSSRGAAPRSSAQATRRFPHVAPSGPSFRFTELRDNVVPSSSANRSEDTTIVNLAPRHVLAPASSRPLHNRRVIVTGAALRQPHGTANQQLAAIFKCGSFGSSSSAWFAGPRQYASKLIGLLVDAGARPLWVPCVEISALDDPDQIADLRKALSDLSRFTHIAFSSKNGINAVLHELECIHGASARSVIEDSGVRLCALGADAQALEQAGYHVHVQPQEASTQGLVRELAARGELDGAQVLCPVPFVTGGLVEPPVVPRFIAALEDGGAAVTRADAYVTRAGVSPEDIAPEAALMSGGCVDAIVFTSTAEAQGLLAALGGVEDLQTLVLEQGIVLAAHGPYTAAGVAAVIDLSVDVVGRAFGSFHGVVAALEAHFTPPRSGPGHDSEPPAPSDAFPRSKSRQAARDAGAGGSGTQQAQQLSGMDHLQLLTP